MLPRRGASSGRVTAIIGAMSLAPPEAAGPLRRERLRTARLYFVCDARPGGEDPEPLLRAALSGGVDIVQLREKELPRREIELRRARPSAASATPTAPSSSSTTTPTWPAPATPTASTSARTTCRPRRRASCSGPTRSSASRPTPRSRSPPPPRQPVDYISVGPIWETPTKQGRPGGRARAGLPRRRARPIPSSRSAASTRPTPREVVAAGAGGSASCARSATPRTPTAAAEALRGAFAAVGERGARWLSSRASASSAAPRPRRASGWSAATPRPRSATRKRAKRWSRWPRASARWW